MEVLNLYAGLGGNRKLWGGVGVTAVEIDADVAQFYSDTFPNDSVIVSDAHEYLKNNYDRGWDFIWSSVPCQTHTNISRMAWESDAPQNADRDPEYPDMRLYQEILFLRTFADCDYVVENVIPYYTPLIEPQYVGRHAFWSNFNIPKVDFDREEIWEDGSIERKNRNVGFDLSDYEFENQRKDQLLNNCVNPELGKHILDSARNNRQTTFDGLAQ